MSKIRLKSGNSLLVGQDYEESSQRAARAIVDDLKNCIAWKNHAVWQVSSGGTPKRTYEIITQDLLHEVDWQRVTLVQMDEYLAVELSDAASQYCFLDESLVSKLPFKEVIRFDREFIENPALFEEKVVEAGGIDIAVHGIGINGHLGFNEPGSKVNSRTRTVALTESTRIANSRFFSCLDRVPTHGVTVGLKTIVEAKKIYLLAFGEAKKRVVVQAISGGRASKNPASVLQSHGNTVYILDRASAAERWITERTCNQCRVAFNQYGLGQALVV